MDACQCHAHQHRRPARQHAAPPRARPGCGVGMSLDDDAVGACDQQAWQGPLAHLNRGSEPLPAAGRVLSRQEAGRHSEGVPPARRCKIARSAERVRRRGQGCEGRGDRADAGHRHQTAQREIPASSLPISALKLASAAISTLRVGMASAGRSHSGSSPSATSFDTFVGSTLRHDLSELTEMTAKGIDGQRARPEQMRVHAEHHGRALGLFALPRHEAPFRRCRHRLSDNTSSAAMPPRKSPWHRPQHSSAASRTA